VLRGYRSEDPANAVAKFVISERDESGKLTNRNFKLCLKKPG
jgi:hypothetical protein